MAVPVWSHKLKKRKTKRGRKRNDEGRLGGGNIHRETEESAREFSAPKSGIENAIAERRGFKFRGRRVTRAGVRQRWDQEGD